MSRNLSRRSFVRAIPPLVAATTALLWPSRASAQDAPKDGASRRVIEERTVSIYSDQAVGDGPDRRSKPERYYDPYYFSPAAKSAQISVSPTGQTTGERGTHLEIAISWSGPNEFATVGFVPTGASALGRRPGLNIEQMLGAAPGQKVYLRFRARRPAGHPEVRAKFRVGGLAGAPHRDSLRFPLETRPALLSLGETWQEYSIDCTSSLSHMNEVLCPFSATLESNENPHARQQDGSPDPVSVLYVDDIRFVAVREASPKD